MDDAVTSATQNSGASIGADDGTLARTPAVLRRLLRTRMALVGLVIVILAIGMALFAPFMGLQSPDEIDTLAMLSGPTASHILGTDDLGRDTFSRLVYGARVSLSASTIAIALAML